MSKNEAIAKAILDAAFVADWEVQVRGDILTITKEIEPGSLTDFSKADSEYYGIISLLPRPRAGSMWGTDGGGVGGLAAIKAGLFVMNVSGGSKLVLRKLAAML